HSLLPIDSCLIHDERIEAALPAFARTASEMGLVGLQNLMLTVEPTGQGLLWRLRFTGGEPRWPRDEFARLVADRLPELTLLDDAMSLDLWDLTFRFFSSRRRHTSSVSAFLLNRSSDLLRKDRSNFLIFRQQSTSI